MAGPARVLLAPVLAVLLLAAAPAGARDVADACPPATGDARAYLDCLGDALKASEAALARDLAGAEAAIAARSSLAEVQRRRWRGLFDEAQGRFTHWRDFECQSVAPYESGDEATVGGRRLGIGSLSARLLCLIRANDARATELSRRYPPPPGWSYQPPAPATPAAAPPATSGVPRIIAP